MLVFLALSWVLVVLYPDPTVLYRSIENIAHPAIDPAAVASIAARLPDNPRVIEAYVLDKQVPYAYDWQTAGVPWYFPTTRDVLRQGSGDCESRAIMLASLLAAKHIPYSLRLSFNHIWVQYPGKVATALENPGVVFAGTSHGHFFIHWPKNFNLIQQVNDQIAIFWTPAPPYRVVLLFGGLLLIMLWNTAAAWLAGVETPARSRPLLAPAPPRRRLAPRPHRV